MSKQSIFQKIQQILSNVDDAMGDRAKLNAVKTYWLVGQMAQAHKDATGMMIKDMAQEIGEPKHNLQQYMQFYRTYARGYPAKLHNRIITWSMFRILMVIHEAKQRDFYLKEMCRLGWNKYEMIRRIKNGYYYAAQDAVGRNDDKSLKRNLVWIFTYAAEVIKVVDGDTLDLEIDIGFKSKQEHRVRLHGINCPEMSTPQGVKAKAFVTKELNKCIVEKPLFKGHYASRPLVVVQTYKQGLYGRYIVDLFYLPQEDKVQRILEKGKWLNQVLLDKKFASRMER